MRILASICLAGAELLCGVPPVLAQKVSGEAYVIDGDTSDVGGVRIRLQGIDAPEGEQPCYDINDRSFDCGSQAKSIMLQILEGKNVACHARDRDRYGRVIATCFVDGADIAEMIVRSDYAFAYTRYSRNYVAAERDARRHQRGLWKAKFEYP